MSDAVEIKYDNDLGRLCQLSIYFRSTTDFLIYALELILIRILNFLSLFFNSIYHCCFFFHLLIHIMYIAHIIFWLLQVVVFISVWLVLLLGICLIVFDFLRKHYPEYPNFALYGAVAVSSSVFFELLLLYNEHKSGQGIYALGGLTYLPRAIQMKVKSIGCGCGHSTAAYLSALFKNLPWLLTLPSLLISSVVIIVAVFAIFRYQFSMGYGLLSISPRVQNASEIPCQKNCNAILADSPLPSITKIEEMYQRDIYRLKK
uniref:Uncharacterized protein n=1 Tax=Heterorhabditis bacteriophora TaxID=37862 RepID=A0A1I7WDV2_HETBA